MIFLWMSVVRLCDRGRYCWRWDWVTVVLVSMWTPEGPALSCIRVEKKRGWPGGSRICLEWLI